MDTVSQFFFLLSSSLQEPLKIKSISPSNPHHENLITLIKLCRASLIAQSLKNLPAVQETQVRSLSWEDPLEKEMATHSSILAWKISWTQEPGGLCSPWGREESGMTEQLTLITVYLLIYCGPSEGQKTSV